jgi:hypothetical protein
MPARKSEKCYDYARALWSEHKALQYRKRILRKLVREALNHPDAMKRGENVADRIAKELVP